MKKRKKYPITHASLYLTRDCNLACTYCYKITDGDNQAIDENTGRLIIDFLIENSNDYLSINFFGGEPLLVFDVVKVLIKYALEKAKQEDKKISFSLNTNGILIDKTKIDFLRKNKIGIVLSIDGTPEAHDLHRVDFSKQGSFQLLEKKLHFFLNNPRNVHIRMTVTPDTVSEMFNGARFIYNLGFKTLAIAMDRTSKGWTNEKKRIYQEKYSEIIDWYIDMMRKGQKFYLVDIDYGAVSIDYPYPDKGMPCSAALGGVAIDGNCQIYPCYRFVGMEGVEIGDIINGIDETKREIYVDYSCYKIPKCEKCEINYRCHRCPWLSYITKGDISTPLEINCFEGRLMLKLFKNFRDIMEREKNKNFLLRKRGIIKRYFKAATF